MVAAAPYVGVARGTAREAEVGSVRRCSRWMRRGEER
jgi:hypothetical protein